MMDKTSPLQHPTVHARLRAVACLLAVAVLLAACCRPAWADDAIRAAVPGEAAARGVEDLAAEVLREAETDGLSEWTRDVIGRALERTGSAASGAAAGAGSTTRSPAPLPAERHAGRVGEGFSSRPNTSEVLVLTSLAVPAASWRHWAREAAAVGAPLVLRGVAEGGLRATVKRIGARLGGAEAGVAIDPRLFRLFGVERVPAVVVVPGGVPPCRSRGCSGDPAPPHDRVTGNIGLIAALEAVAEEGDAGRSVAKAHLERLAGDRR